jgi:pimeloyl-ACP methyl ester carboxylesterase
MFGDADAIDDQAVQIQATNAERRRFPAETLSSALPLRTILPRMSCPLSAIYGSADKSIGPHLQTRIDYFRALHRDANFAIVSGAGHWLQYEAPAAFEAALTSVLDEPRGGWIKSFARPPTVTA